MNATTQTVPEQKPLTDVDLILLRTAVLSHDGTVFTVGFTPGAERAEVLMRRRVLELLRNSPWNTRKADREWRITDFGRRVLATYEKTR